MKINQVLTLILAGALLVGCGGPNEDGPSETYAPGYTPPIQDVEDPGSEYVFIGSEVSYGDLINSLDEVEETWVTPEENTEIDVSALEDQIPPEEEVEGETVTEFLGLNMVGAIGPTSVTLYWTKVPDTRKHIVFQVKGEDLQKIKTVGKNSEKVTLRGLSPDTEYSFMVKQQNTSKQLDSNEVVLSVRTNPPADLTNSTSLVSHGEGDEAVENPESVKMVVIVFTKDGENNLLRGVKNSKGVWTFHQNTKRLKTKRHPEKIAEANLLVAAALSGEVNISSSLAIVEVFLYSKKLKSAQIRLVEDTLLYEYSIPNKL